MNRPEYDAIPAVNYSLLKDLAVSPLRAWYKHVRPNREPFAPTPEMELGTALHVAVLQPMEFDNRYFCELEPPADALVTMEDLRGYARDAGLMIPGASNKRKEDLVAWLSRERPGVPILDVMQSRHAAANGGKQMFKREDWQRLTGMAVALADEPSLRKLLDRGEAEKVLQATDKETGLRLKGMLDWDGGAHVADLKSMTVKHGRTVDRSVADAVFYEKYYLQAVFYSKLKGEEWKGDYVLAFVESDEPHETRLRSIERRNGALLWNRGALEIRGLLKLYKDYMDHFGPDKPWRYACAVTPVEDEEIPALMY